MTDNAFDALSNGYRRRLLVDLLNRNPQHMGAVSGPSEVLLPDEERDINRHHLHLPKLVEYGFIDWDREHAIVTKGPCFDEIKPLLELLDENRALFSVGSD